MRPGGEVSAAEVAAAQEWWDTLGDGRMVQVHRWVSQNHGPPEQDAGQLTIEDAIGDPQ